MDPEPYNSSVHWAESLQQLNNSLSLVSVRRTISSEKGHCRTNFKYLAPQDALEVMNGTDTVMVSRLD